MSGRVDTEDLRQVFLSGAPMMDMRSPVEFDKGAFPTAVNLPLMSDEERRKVGTLYKIQGQAAAIELGHFLVSGEVKENRLKAWCDFARSNPDGYLYCFRGGLRSQTVQTWLKEAGVDYPLIKGGYKALRRFLIDETDRIATQGDFLIIGGRTGSGKTLLVHDLPTAVDLEGLANHKGSSFGRPVDDTQPTQIAFENALGVDLLRRNERALPRFAWKMKARGLGGWRYRPPSWKSSGQHRWCL